MLHIAIAEELNFEDHVKNTLYSQLDRVKLFRILHGSDIIPR